MDEEKLWKWRVRFFLDAGWEFQIEEPKADHELWITHAGFYATEEDALDECDYAAEKLGIRLKAKPSRL